MELKNVTCTICGGLSTVDVAGKIPTAKCKYCGNSFVIEIAEKLSKIEVDRTKDLPNLRKRLSEAVANNDARNISAAATKILDIIPEDYSAKYFFAYAESRIGKNSYISDFYAADATAYTEEELQIILNHINEFSSLRDKRAVNSYLANLPDTNNVAAFDAYNAAYKKREKLEQNYEDIPRDVFICHRSTDKEKALRVMKALENDSHKCWISYRNLRPFDSENYNDNIKKAIKSCSVFLVLTSHEAMYSDDVKREIDSARSLNKPRVEFVLEENLERTPLFKAFFDGCQWVEGFELTERSLLNLRHRMFDELEKLKAADKKLSEIEEFKRQQEELLKRQQEELAELIKAQQSIAATTQTVIREETQGGIGIIGLLKKAKLQIDDGDFAEASKTCDKASDIDIEHPELWICRLLIETKSKNLTVLSNRVEDFTTNNNYLKALRFATGEQKNGVQKAVEKAKQNLLDLQERQRKEAERIRIEAERIRIETEKEAERQAELRRQEQYDSLIRQKNNSVSELDYLSLVKCFKDMNGYKDSRELSNECDRLYISLKAEREKNEYEKAERRREKEKELAGLKRQKKYESLLEDMNNKHNSSHYRDLANAFRSMNGYKDSKQLETKCIQLATLQEKRANILALFIGVLFIVVTSALMLGTMFGIAAFNNLVFDSGGRWFVQLGLAALIAFLLPLVFRGGLSSKIKTRRICAKIALISSLVVPIVFDFIIMGVGSRVWFYVILVLAIAIIIIIACSKTLKKSFWMNFPCCIAVYIALHFLNFWSMYSSLVIFGSVFTLIVLTAVSVLSSVASCFGTSRFVEKDPKKAKMTGLLSLVLVVVVAVVGVFSFTKGNDGVYNKQIIKEFYHSDWQFRKHETGMAIYFKSSMSGDVVIPSTNYAGQQVTAIKRTYGSSSTFTSSNFESVTSVELPSGLKVIDECAFYGFRSLQSIVIPNGVTIIGGGAFDDCYSLQKIVIPASVIEVNTHFRGCENLTIYVEADSKPETWSEEWNYFNYPVEWGYKGD